MQMQQELQQWMTMVNYQQFNKIIMDEAIAFLQAYPNFKPCVESMQFPGEQRPNNLLIFKGQVQL